MKRPGQVLAALALVSFFVISAALFRRPADAVFEGRLTSDWTRDLLSSDYTIRGEAKAALMVLGEPGVPQLRALLQHRNGPWEKPLACLNEYLPVLNYHSLDANLCRTRASEMLGALGCKAHSAVPDLVAALAYDQSAPETERALVRIGSASVPALERALHSRHDSNRVRAARLLREFSFPQDSTTLALIGATRDPLPAVREQAVLSLGVTAHDFPDALPHLEKLARDQNDQVRAAALQALGEVGDAAPQVIVALQHGLRDRSTGVALAAAKSLWMLRHDSQQIIPVLITTLTTEERWRAAYVLGDMGPRAAAAVPALVRLLAEERVPRPFRTPPSSAFALGKIGSPAIAELTLLLKDPDARVRMNALMAFGLMGKSGSAAVPHLLEVLQDNSSEVRHTAALTIASITTRDRAPAQIIGSLTDCLHAEDIYMRSAAAAFLRDLAPDQTWFVPAE